MATILGIDLGTTNSLAAHLTDDGPRIIPNALGQPLTPSVVAVDKAGVLLVGQAAFELQVTEPNRCASLFKRFMGSDWSTTLGGRKFTPEMLSSLVLRSLKQDAEAALGETIGRAVITVPAYFNDQQRKATIAAGEMAGFVVERIVNEPTAAALAYGFHEAAEDKLILVFDLGGGTFDVSVVEIFEGAVEVRASSGESFLGGEDFTRAMAARVLETQGLSFEHAEAQAPRLVSRIIQQCEIAKRRMSRDETAEVRICTRDGEFGPDAPQVTLRRPDFEQWTQSLLARVELPIRRALGDAKLGRNDIDQVILVGGATRMPAVVELVRRMFNKEPRQKLNPDEVVALGAAVQAGLIAQHRGVADLVVTDVCPFSLGIETSKQFGRERRDGYFAPIIDRNTTIPVSEVKRFSTLDANQTQLKVKVYQGESRRVAGNLLLGEFMVSEIPRGPAGSEYVDVRFTYDLNGVLEVEATVVSTKQRMRRLITKHAKGLSAAQIEAAARDMAKLKTSPREEATNRFLLQRAERVYRELPLAEREFLTGLLDGFEGALDVKDAQAIERFRVALVEFLDVHDGGQEDAAEDADA
ncbi:MAG TPA: molecular chaperone HscC [Pirellulales bacterium]|jgi:molecular chaperone HscC